MGFSLGAEDDLVPPELDNPAGYWESASLVAANDEILAALGGTWSAPPHMDPGWETRPDLDALRPRAAALAASVLAAPRWVWKDPRACLTLPFWLPMLDRRIAIVLVQRNPLEVATSLEARDGFPVPLGLALWERYVRSALAAAAGLPVCITRYEELVVDPAGWCGRVAGFLRARGGETAEIPADALSSAVRPDLRHATIGTERLMSDPAVSSEQRAIAAALEAQPPSHGSFTPPALPPETPWVGVLLDERRRRLRATHDLGEARARVAGIEASRSYRLLGPLRTIHAALAARRP